MTFRHLNDSYFKLLNVLHYVTDFVQNTQYQTDPLSKFPKNQNTI